MDNAGKRIKEMVSANEGKVGVIIGVKRSKFGDLFV